MNSCRKCERNRIYSRISRIYFKLVIGWDFEIRTTFSNQMHEMWLKLYFWIARILHSSLFYFANSLCWSGLQWRGALWGIRTEPIKTEPIKTEPIKTLTPWPNTRLKLKGCFFGCLKCRIICLRAETCSEKKWNQKSKCSIYWYLCNIFTYILWNRQFLDSEP